MYITAVFESWHIGDGNYPPLHRGQLVRLSFEPQLKRLMTVGEPRPPSLNHLGDARYAGSGWVLRRYGRGGEAIAVIETLGFRFYVHGPRAERLKQGLAVELEGTLLLDHYMWVELLDQYSDPPDLFYNLRVTRIRKVCIPERFVRRSQNQALSYPTTVPPEDFGEVEELDTMEGQELTLEFYVVDFSGEGLQDMNLPRTFQ